MTGKYFLVANLSKETRFGRICASRSGTGQDGYGMMECRLFGGRRLSQEPIGLCNKAWNATKNDSDVCGARSEAVATNRLDQKRKKIDWNRLDPRKALALDAMKSECEPDNIRQIEWKPNRLKGR
jgi:hypothetical protein